MRGVATGPDWQLVLIDLPGVQRPRDALTQRMARRVTLELADADAALILLNGEEGVGPGDRYIAASLAQASGPVTVAVNKVDRLSKERQAQALLDAAEIAPPAAEVFPISARSGQGVAALVAHLVAQELPHAIGVVIEELAADEHDGELTRIDALIWVETESQKAIVVGRAGRMVKAIGTAARRELERELGGRVHLSLVVRVRRHWRADDGLLDRLGIE